MTAPARVAWYEGMYLAPHHFQAQRRQHEATVARTLEAVFPFAWGVTAAALDPGALANGTLALAHARGLLPDGTPFDVPEADPAPAPVALAERFSPVRDAHVVHLVLPAWRSGAANVADVEAASGALHGSGPNGTSPDGGASDPRYQAVTRDVADEASGRDAAPVRFAVKRLRLALDGEVPEGAVSVPVGRVARDGAGRFVVDVEYVPPCLTYSASARLVGLLRTVIGMLEAKGAALAATLPTASSPATGGEPSAYAGNELATRWLLHAVRSAEAPLRHLAAVRHVHPERLWLELVRLAGALCTFSLTASAGELPAYAHDDLTGCFGALERHLRAHLDVVVAASAVIIPLRAVSDILHAAVVPDPRCFAAGARWFLGVSAALPAAELSARVPQLIKACASKYVLELVRRAYPGMAVDHVPAAPAGLAPRPGLAYFELALAGPCAKGLQDTREIGVYVPADALPGAALELAVLLPS